MNEEIVFIESSTNDGVFYRVTKKVKVIKECTCPGFVNHGKCKHIMSV